MMKNSDVKPQLDTGKWGLYLPAWVSIASGLLYVVSVFGEITWTYTLILMLAIGFSASGYLVFLTRVQKNPVSAPVPLDEPGGSVFVEIDSAEDMLLDLETITMLVSEISCKQIESSRIQTEDAITAILDRFLHLSEGISALSISHDLKDDEEMKRLDSSLSEIMVSFQFQDRTSQVLHHVTNSLGMFSDEIKSIQALREKGGQPEYDKLEIMNKITAGFTTAEQRQIISTKTSDDSTNNVEFF